MGDFGGIIRNGLAYNREARSQWNPTMESGIGNLVDKFSGLGVNGSSKDSLFQVMKAVNAAESAITQQAEENNRLRSELQRKTEELERYRSDDSTALRRHSDGRGEHIQGPYKPYQSVSSIGNQGDRVRWWDDTNSPDPHESQHYIEGNMVNGNLKVVPGGQAAADNTGFSQFSTPSSRSFFFSREGEYDSKFNLAGQGLMPMPEVNNSISLWKQVREHEEEILQLRKHLADYSIKEAQIHSEKYVLEKQIAHMRMAFDQQQQDLVDAQSKALSYRQNIIEENIRLTYELQTTQLERSTFASSLLPLLAEYSLQPPVPDAQSIVNNLKVLFKHLQEKLIVTEAKLNESQYQLAPWHSDVLNHSSFTPESPAHSIGAPLTTSNKNGLELVPQATYSHGHTPITSPFNAQTTTYWDPLGYHSHHTGFGGVAAKNLESDKLGRSSPSASRNSAGQDAPAQHVVDQGDPHAADFSEETVTKQLTFKGLASGNEMDDQDPVGNQNGREPSAYWGSGSSSYLTPALDDPNSSFSPYLPPVLEEPSSSFSEAAEDESLPAIEDLQISGEAFPGQVLQAGGYSINGTTSCNFEWVRYLEDGSVYYIEGAKQPKYLVTADDVNSYLAIEVQPLDDRKRKGELVKVFANEQRKITCDSEMQEQIERTFHSGHASYEVSLSAGYLDIWEPAILAIKKAGYSIKCNGPRGVVVTEKFLPSTSVTIPAGQTTAFSILSSGGVEHTLRTTDSSSLRDTIVFTMRLFIVQVVEKRKGRKRGLFFNK